MRLRRLSVRFDGVVARLRAGVFPVPRRAGVLAVPRAPACVDAPDALPRRRGWLADLLRHEAAAYGGYDGRLGYLLRDPDMVALLAASPQIGRVLRPLWRMLSTDKMPRVLRPPRGVRGSSLSEAAPIGAALGGAPPEAWPALPDTEMVEADASPSCGPAAPISD